MIKSIFVLGRQPEIGRAELERLIPDSQLIEISDLIVGSDAGEDVDIDRLGGTVKTALVIDEIDYTDWRVIEGHLHRLLPNFIESAGEGKLNLGISVYGLKVDPRQINASTMSLKKVLRESGKSVRVVPSQSSELSSAQVYHNKLAKSNGVEMLVIAGRDQIYFAKTTGVQNINAYAARDQRRPKRDAKVGMLPPKLAQIMINLARPASGATLLDPFCGTGVVLQEGLIMGHPVIGSDLEPRMVEYSKANLEWLGERYPNLPPWEVSEGDATSYKWKNSIDNVVCETYLGEPLFRLPPLDHLKSEALKINNLTKRFLENLAFQLKPGSTLCIAVPAWKLNEGFLTLPLLDHLEEIGYNHISFETVDTKDLIYHRPDQLVARQLVTLTRK